MNPSLEKMGKRQIHRHEANPQPPPRSLRTIILLWSVYTFCLLGTFFWLSQENDRLLVLYHQAPECGSAVQTQDNCRQQLAATLIRADYIEGGQAINRQGGSSRSPIHAIVDVDLELRLPDGTADATRLSQGLDTQPPDDNTADLQPWLFWLDIQKITQGEVWTVTRWQGKIISVKQPHYQTIYTLDHPLNSTHMLFTRAQGLFILLFFLLLSWSFFKILRKP